MYGKCVRNSHNAHLKILKLYVIYSMERKINLAFGFWGKMSHCNVFEFLHYK